VRCDSCGSTSQAESRIYLGARARWTPVNRASSAHRPIEKRRTRPQFCNQHPGAPGEGARRSPILSQLARLTETLRSRTPATGELSAGTPAFGNWEQSMRFELSLPGKYCYSFSPILSDILPAAWQRNGRASMRNATRGMVFRLKSTGNHGLVCAPLVERLSHYTAFSTSSP
jgi:hypothetical protein